MAILLSASALAPAPKVKIPKKANAVIEAKCYGCHSAEGRSDKAKAALRWDQLDSLSTDLQADKFAAIEKVLEEGSMPPARMVERNPDMKLTDAETALLAKWAGNMSKKLSR